MKLWKLWLLSLVMCIPGCVSAIPVKEADLTYTKILDLPSQSKDQIYERSRQWVATTFKSAKAVMEYENKTDGVIIGNGSMPRPISLVNIDGTDMLLYTMREDIKDGKARLTFNNLATKVGPYGVPGGTLMPGYEGTLREGDLPGMRATFDLMALDLQRFILQSKADNW